MPSWNIHTAHVERLLADNPAAELGIEDANAFLFGNYIPDIYVGFMVPDATIHIDYRITHVNSAYMVPVPDADRFWDGYLRRFLPESEAGRSLLLGVWAHLATDRVYNGRMRNHCIECGAVVDEPLRIRKQSDFALFGQFQEISSHVRVTPELLDAARRFPSYTILEEDVRRAVKVADAIVDENGCGLTGDEAYQELSAEWMSAAFDACDERLSIWLRTWHRLGGFDASPRAAQIREAAGIPPVTPDDPNWMDRIPR